MQVLNLVASGWLGKVGGCTVDASEIWRCEIDQLRFGSLFIPFFYRGFIDIPGGWPWDFWTINSVKFHLYIYIHIGLGGSVFLFFSWLSLHKLQKPREFLGQCHPHENGGSGPNWNFWSMSICWKKNVSVPRRDVNLWTQMRMRSKLGNWGKR